MFTLCVLFFGWTLLPGILTLIAGADTNPDIPAWLVAATGGGVLAVGGILLLCGMFIAELTRRGSITNSSNRARAGDFRGDAQSAKHPTASHLARRSQVLAAALLATPTLIDGDAEIFMTWFIWGAFLVPVTGATLGSLVKKTCYFRWYGRQPGASSGRVRRTSQPFWRWFSYRWRLDLWLCGTGYLAVASGLFIAGMLAYLPKDEFGDAEDIAEATTVVIALLSFGVPTLLFALWTCTQFWRTGEDINTGESAS